MNPCEWRPGTCGLPGEVQVTKQWLCAWHDYCMRTRTKSEDIQAFDAYLERAQDYCCILSHYTRDHLWACIKGRTTWLTVMAMPCKFTSCHLREGALDDRGVTPLDGSPFAAVYAAIGVITTATPIEDVPF